MTRRGKGHRGSWRRWPRHRVIATLVGALAVALLFAWTRGTPTAAGTWTRDEILAAIRFVESGGREFPPDGDGGRAIGPYQIHRIYWLDAIQTQPQLGGDYQHCRQRDYAERVIAAYMTRWVPKAWAAGDAEVIARTHNGGPTGRNKRATDRYWQRVRRALP
ncbi:MAG: hypothetical protein NXI31_19310 [bacterium]|nr:hypothetical protein [bacterium]